MNIRTSHRAFVVAGIALVGLLFTGCLDTEYSLGDPAASVVNRDYCGDWLVSRRDEKGQTQSAMLVVRNLNDREYYVEWFDPTKGETDKLRMLAFVADVKGVSFVHLQGLGEDGNNSATHLIFRFEMDGDKLVIRELSDKFFKEKDIQSDAQLRDVVEENLDNKDMYQGEPLTGMPQTK